QHKKDPTSSKTLILGDPGGIRTPDPRLRRSNDYNLYILLILFVYIIVITASCRIYILYFLYLLCSTAT
ncbi:hypothetical protein, partial [Veillonella montpellierensis]|uniref:hypothetical protein n=1 Tax=Veillonella montpellierensis TaxID=187328 RepID=UPI001E46D153